jgi:hypothetical protein
VKKYVYSEVFLLSIFSLHQFSVVFGNPIGFAVMLIMKAVMSTIVFLTCIEFVNLVLYLKSKFDTLNVSLEAYEKKLNKQDVKLFTVIKLNSQFQTKDVKKQHITAYDADTVKKLRIAYQILIKISEYINDLYGLKILAIMTCLLVIITSHIILFLDSVMLLSPTDDTLEDFKLASSNFLWLVLNIGVFAISPVSCQLALQAADRTAFLVQQCLLIEGIGDDFRSELQAFAIQILSKKLRFSSCGVFDLDTTLLLSASSTAATYTVILLTVK